jgi:hypothetical protein
MTHSQALEKILAAIDYHRYQGFLAPRISYLVAGLAILATSVSALSISYVSETKARSDAAQGTLAPGENASDMQQKNTTSNLPDSTSAKSTIINARNANLNNVAKDATTALYMIAVTDVLVVLGLLVYGAIIWRQINNKKRITCILLHFSNDILMRSSQYAPLSVMEFSSEWKVAAGGFAMDCCNKSVRTRLQDISSGTLILVHAIVREYAETISGAVPLVGTTGTTLGAFCKTASQ